MKASNQILNNLKHENIKSTIKKLEESNAVADRFYYACNDIEQELMELQYVITDESISSRMNKLILDFNGIRMDYYKILEKGNIEPVYESIMDAKRVLNIEDGSDEEQQLDSTYDYLIDVSGQEPIAHIYTGKGNSDPGINIYEIDELDDKVLAGFGDLDKAMWCDIETTEDGEFEFELYDLNKYKLSDAIRINYMI